MLYAHWNIFIYPKGDAPKAIYTMYLIAWRYIITDFYRIRYDGIEFSEESILIRTIDREIHHTEQSTYIRKRNRLGKNSPSGHAWVGNPRHKRIDIRHKRLETRFYFERQGWAQTRRGASGTSHQAGDSTRRRGEQDATKGRRISRGHSEPGIHRG